MRSVSQWSSSQSQLPQLLQQKPGKRKNMCLRCRKCTQADTVESEVDRWLADDSEDVQTVLVFQRIGATTSASLEHFSRAKLVLRRTRQRMRDKKN